MKQQDHLHKTLLDIFLRYHNEDINIEKMFNKFPIPGADYMFNRVVVVTNDTVYKIHPVKYTEKQKELVSNITPFFEHYPYSLSIAEHYREDICWTEWTRIHGVFLGWGHLENDVWEKYLDYVVHVWNLHIDISKTLETPRGQMWWHYDVTPWNVLIQSDNFFLIDWDDFCLINTEEAKQWTIDQNIEFAEINNQDQSKIYEKLQ